MLINNPPKSNEIPRHPTSNQHRNDVTTTIFRQVQTSQKASYVIDRVMVEEFMLCVVVVSKEKKGRRGLL